MPPTTANYAAFVACFYCVLFVCYVVVSPPPLTWHRTRKASRQTPPAVLRPSRCRRRLDPAQTPVNKQGRCIRVNTVRDANRSSLLFKTVTPVVQWFEESAVLAAGGESVPSTMTKTTTKTRSYIPAAQQVATLGRHKG